MKKLFMLVLTISLFLISIKTNAQDNCPEGYSERTFTFPYNERCNFSVTICYICSVTGEETITIKWIEPSKHCPDWTPENWATFVDNMYDELNNGGWLISLCTDEVPPCPVKSYYTLHKPRCFKKYRNNDGDIVLIACNNDSFYCLETWSYCWSNIYGFIKQKESGPTPIGTPSCNYVLPYPDDPVDPGDYSICFQLKPGC